MILEEIVETCFIGGAARGWGNAAIPLLERILDRVPPELKRTLGTRVAAFHKPAGDRRQTTDNEASASNVASSGAVASAAPSASK
jgi:hypothetical protein